MMQARRAEKKRRNCSSEVVRQVQIFQLYQLYNLAVRVRCETVLIEVAAI